MAPTAVTPARPHSFRIDNILIDEYAAEIGAIGLAIYAVLARHADRRTGACWPSIQLIQGKLHLGRSTVKRYLRKLTALGLIAINDRWSAEGDPTSHLYTLLDPAPAAVAARRQRQAAAQSATRPDPPRGRSPENLPRSPENLPTVHRQPTPGFPVNPEQDPIEQDPRNKASNGTSTENPGQPSRQATCPHPQHAIHRLHDGITICHHCFTLLDDGSGSVQTLTACAGTQVD